jgi:hypothetical protein
MEDAVTTFAPTDEQQAVIGAYLRGEDVVVNAFAGTGKTSTLRMLVEADRYKKFLYVAYNRAARDDAEGKFPINARCSTSHGLAYRPMIHMAQRLKGQKKFVGGPELARLMKITGPVRLTPDRVLAPGQFASVVKATIMKFCYSADEKIGRWHVPNDLRRFTEDEVNALRLLVPPVAQKVWDTDINTDHGVVPMQHDYYLKAFALTDPDLPGVVIALDEAQDSNKCVADMILKQRLCRTAACPGYGRTDCPDKSHRKQVIMTGDTYQAIYGWRGAVDAMESFSREPGVTVLYLTQSFRFGEAVAAEGQKLLTLLGAVKTLRGYEKITSRVGPIPGPGAIPDAILCRTNAEAFRQAIEMLAAGKRVAFPKGAGELTALVKGAAQIKRGEPCEHPDLMAFATWGQVQDYAENEPDGQDLKLLVDLVDKYGIDELFDLLRQIGNADKGAEYDVLVSTAHGAKGLEWRLVRIAGDFLPPKDGKGIPRDQAMLLYVALTRAQYVLDCEAVAWIDGYLADFLAQPEPDPAALAEIAEDHARETLAGLADDTAELAEAAAQSPATARAMALAQI